MSRSSASPAGEAAPGAELIAIATELTRLLEHETALVRALKVAAIGPLQADKVRLTKALQYALKEVDTGKPGPSVARQKWQAAGKKLADAVIANERALRIGRAATERLVATVVAAVTENRRPFRTYAPPRRRAQPRDLAGVALDRKL
ncbi:MAG: hypothetical protein ACREFQ_22650 [Stellaceae bacterium]